MGHQEYDREQREQRRPKGYQCCILATSKETNLQRNDHDVLGIQVVLSTFMYGSCNQRSKDPRAEQERPLKEVDEILRPNINIKIRHGAVVSYVLYGCARQRIVRSLAGYVSWWRLSTLAARTWAVVIVLQYTLRQTV
jgi:hypothetical protein